MATGFFKNSGILSGTNLTELSTEIVRLKSLRTLALDGNKLKALPLEIGELNSLKYLSLLRNKFSKQEKEIIKNLLPNCKIYFE